MKIKEYEVHPAANLFPMMGEKELAELAKDIWQYGQRIAAVVFDGKLLDGRNRVAACKMAGVAPHYVTLEVCPSPTAFVVSANVHRRHLTAAQKSVLATEVLPLFEAEAKARQRKSADVPNKKVAVREIIPQASKGKATEKAAAAVGVNPRYVSDAKRIKEKSPKTFEKMRSGQISIPEAKKSIFRFPPKQQPEPPMGDEKPDSAQLLQLKIWWNRASKKDRKAFLEYVKTH